MLGFRPEANLDTLLYQRFTNPLVQFENPYVWYSSFSAYLSTEQEQGVSVNSWNRLFEPDLVHLLPFIANQAGWNRWLQSLLKGPAENPLLEQLTLLIVAADSVNRMDVLRPLVLSLCELFTSSSVSLFSTELDQQLTTTYASMAEVQQHRKNASTTLEKLLEPFAAITRLETLPTFERRPDQQQLLFWCSEFELYAALSRARALQESLLGSVGSGAVTEAGYSFT